jgi:hypothetical protein
MCVEKNGLGCLEVFCVFYEIEALTRRQSCVIKGNTCGAQERVGSQQALFGCFITMKLNHSVWYSRACGTNVGQPGIYKEQHRREEGG